MTRFWLALVLILAFSPSIVAQSGPIHVPSYVAASHLKSSRPPDYPSAAEVARIQGNVILRIAIDQYGNVSSLQLMQGHPMLAPAALSSVRSWKYSPFTANGQPVSAITVVVVRFGNPGNDADDKVEVVFQDVFWAAIDRAQAALAAGDLAAAEKELAEAQTSLLSRGALPGHSLEHWQWAVLVGDLNRRQNKFTDAEQRYKEALALQENNRNSPEMASSLLALGRLHFEANRPELAQEELTKAISTYQKNYKAAAKLPGAEETLARGIADASWMLAKMAVQQHHQDAAAQQCRSVLDYRGYLSAGDPKVEECERLLATPKPVLP
jgi:TonB family protein